MSNQKLTMEARVEQIERQRDELLLALQGIVSLKRYDPIRKNTNSAGKWTTLNVPTHLLTSATEIVAKCGGLPRLDKEN